MPIIQPGLVGRCAEEEDLLPGGPDPLSDGFGKELTEPWPAGKEVQVSRDRRAIGELQSFPLDEF